MRFIKRIKSSLSLGGIAAALLILAVACGPSAPAGPEPAASQNPTTDKTASMTEPIPESVVAVSFANDQLNPETIRVKQGDQVTLNLNTDRPGTFHIHGYDLEQAVEAGQVTQFQFEANATGRFRINFHGMAATPEEDMAATMDMDMGKDMTMDTDKTSGGGHDMAGMAGATMDHGPAESALPVSIEIAAQVDDRGGVFVTIETDGWRWAPEEVSGANSAGAGHAHIYADGVKLSRVYGDRHYLTGLEPGVRELSVSLTSNDHSDLSWQGSLLAASATITAPEASAMDHQEMAEMAAPDPVDSDGPMALEVVAHEDPLGGYNLQVIPDGFEFARSANQDHVPGQGYALLSIGGEEFSRMYVPWLQVPAQGEGEHTLTVVLLNNEGQPYQYDGLPVSVSVTVHEETPVGDSGSETGEDAATDHHGSDASASGGHQEAESGEAELEVGYLEVLP